VVVEVVSPILDSEESLNSLKGAANGLGRNKQTNIKKNLATQNQTKLN
jgi:hypothetical protein